MKTYIVDDPQGLGLVCISARGKKHAKAIIQKTFKDSVHELVIERAKDNVKLLKPGNIIYSIR